MSLHEKVNGIRVGEALKQYRKAYDQIAEEHRSVESALDHPKDFFGAADKESLDDYIKKMQGSKLRHAGHAEIVMVSLLLGVHIIVFDTEAPDPEKKGYIGRSCRITCLEPDPPCVVLFRYVVHNHEDGSRIHHYELLTKNKKTLFWSQARRSLVERSGEPRGEARGPLLPPHPEVPIVLLPDDTPRATIRVAF